METPAKNAERWKLVGICFFLAIITIGTFARTLGNGFVNFDDDEYVVDNAHVNQGVTGDGIVWAFTRVHSSNWHPLTWISHMVDCQLYQLQPAGHHLSSVLIHAATVVALFLTLRSLTGSLWPSAFVAALFAVHPLRVESVAWVSERKDVLSGFFFVLTIGAYTRYARNPRSSSGFALVMAFYALGLLCKPMLVTLPFILLLLDFWPLRRAATPMDLVLEKIPLFTLSLLSCVVTLYAQSQAIRPVEAFSLPVRLVTALLACKTYLQQIFYPAGLAAFYPFPLRGLSSWHAIFSAVLLAAISFVGWRERKTRPWLLVGWCWYLAMLVPVIGIVQVGAQSHADRYTYLPHIGIYMVLAWLAAEFFSRLRLPAIIPGGLAAGIIGGLMYCSWVQAGYWKNSETLWRHALACTKDNKVAYLNLGHELYKQGRWDEVIAHYQQGLRTEPDNAEFHNNLANAFRQKGDLDGAIAQYQRAVELRPNFADAQFNLGKAYGLKGRSADAVTQYGITLQIEPGFTPAHMSMGNELLKLGKTGDAAAQFQVILSARPHDAGLHQNLGFCFSQMNRMSEAVGEYETALQIKPGDPQIGNNLAWILATCPDAGVRNGTKALELARQAAEQGGGSNPIILRTLAAAWAESGRFPEAINAVRQAIERAAANPALSHELEREMKLYQSGQPMRDPGEPGGK